VTLTLIAVFVGFQNYEISTDSLTGLNNRRRFDKYISSASTEIYPSRKLFLLMMDINHFKKINDTFGHLEGDCALMEAAALLRQACMDDDIFLARYGGDEFVAVGMFEDREEAEQYKKKIRNRFDRRNRKEQILYQLVLSIGIAEYHMELSDGLETLIREADQNMYYEKDTQYQQQMRQLRNKQVVG
jgi:diguanylate cyclase (GGDEF)-like protein